MAVEVITGETTVVEVVIPGPQGPAGADGADGADYVPPDYTDVIYLAKHGSNSNNGRHPDRAVLTIDDAVTKANALATGSNRVRLQVIDDGTYEADAGSLTLSDVNLCAPGATIIGALTLSNRAYVTADRLYPAENNQVLVAKDDSAVNVYVRANEIDGRGTDGTLTGTTLVRNTVSGGIHTVYANKYFIPQDGLGATDQGTGFAHIHIQGEDFYLAGDNALGLELKNNNDIVFRIGHVLEFGSPAGTTFLSSPNPGEQVTIVCTEIVCHTGFSVVGNSSSIHATVARLVCTTAWDVSGGAFYINAASVSGTRTHTGGTVGAVVASDSAVTI